MNLKVLLLVAALAASSSICSQSPVFSADAPAARVMTKQEQDALLAKRLDSAMQFSFSKFSNMFYVFSNQQIGKSVGLATSSKEIAATNLQSPFPKFYKATLREMLDAIALQTFSKWEYDPSGKFVDNKTGDKAASQAVVFEFKEDRNRPKPYELKTAAGWKSVDKGNWVMYTPADIPIGMDVYEMGTYSTANPADDSALLTRVRSELALEWAKRVKPRANKSELKPAQVGPYEALYFEAVVPSQMKKDVRWRQWVFTAGNKAYFIVSTIFPENDAKLFPAVQEMLKSFSLK